MAGSVHAINVSRGGVPKRQTRSAFVGWDGLEGDRQADRRYHGGPERAVTLFSLERIESLKDEGHPISPGSIGENLTLTGVDWKALASGVQLEVGQALLELTKPASPCQKISSSFLDGHFGRVAEKAYPGWSRWCARVLRQGLVTVGDAARLVRS